MDVGPLVAHLNESDQWHVWADAAMRFLSAVFCGEREKALVKNV